MNRRSVYTSVVVVLASAAWAQAVVVNIDFNQQGNHPAGVTSRTYVGTAAAPDAGTVWNGVEVVDNNAFQGPPGEFGFWASSVSASGLRNSLGVATPLGINLVATADTGCFGVLEGSPNLGAVATNAVDLMRDYLIGFNAPQSVVLNGFVPGQVMSLYLYGAGDTDNRDTLFSITDRNGPHTATTTGTVTGDGNNPVSHVLTLGGDYVILAGIVADTAGNVTITYDNGLGSNEAPFNGLQVVYAIPEPSGAALALAALPLLARRRR